MSIKNNWNKIKDEIANIAGRNVEILAVTKRRSVEEIRQTISAGASLLGENRVDEAREKFVQKGLLKEFPEIKLHFIGHLQRRKVRDVVEFFDCIQSVESEKLAVEIDKRCAAINKKIDVLIEVNVSGEEQKHGISPAQTEKLAIKILSLQNLNLKGLMTMAPYTSDEQILRATFSGLRRLKEDLSKKFGGDFFKILSMGMSNDYIIAVEEGSTMVRIGTAVFED